MTITERFAIEWEVSLDTDEWRRDDSPDNSFQTAAQAKAWGDYRTLMVNAIVPFRVVKQTTQISDWEPVEQVD